MKLSTKGRYGLKAMLDIAINGKDQCVSLKQIAERQSLSENYLEQLISLLKKSGLLKSTRGAQGGYTLSKNPEQITVGDILRALEGSLAPVDCVLVNENKKCSDSNGCVTKFIWKKVTDSINDVVDNITLMDLVDEHNSLNL